MLLICYEFILWMLALFVLPKMLYSFFMHKKYHQSLFARLGFQKSSFDQSPFPSIWIHAISAGETRAIAHLGRELKQRFPNNPLIVSSTTESGYTEAKKSLSFADHHVYLPFDFRWIMKRMVKKAAPAVVILSESDFWLNFLVCAKEQGAKIGLVNGKLSEDSTRRFRLAPFFAKPLFNLFDTLCVQNVLYRDRFIEVGTLPAKIKVTGNLKLEEENSKLSEAEIRRWKENLGLHADDIVLTIGSTHAPEEEFFLKTLRGIWAEVPHLRVLLVPRHPERCKEVSRLLEKEQISWINWTQIHQRTNQEKVILIDAMGILRICYQLSDLTIVAGSFVKHVGGHNILEPAYYGKPVIYGPDMDNQLEFAELVKRYDAGEQVQPEQLLPVLQEWINNPAIRQEKGQRGLALIKNLKGSTEQTLQALEPLFCHAPKKIKLNR